MKPFTRRERLGAIMLATVCLALIGLSFYHRHRQSENLKQIPKVEIIRTDSASARTESSYEDDGKEKQNKRKPRKKQKTQKNKRSPKKEKRAPSPTPPSYNPREPIPINE